MVGSVTKMSNTLGIHLPPGINKQNSDSEKGKRQLERVECQSRQDLVEHLNTITPPEKEGQAAELPLPATRT